MQNIKATQTHCGQYQRYGDFFEVWKVETTETDKDAVVKWCLENLVKRDIPHEDEYRKRSCYGGDKWDDADYHFAGYYSIKSIEGGYEFTVCEPSTH